MIGKLRRPVWLGATAVGSVLALIATASGDVSAVTPPTRGINSSQIAPGSAADTKTQTGTYEVADLFGESDEEKAARLAAQQHEQAQDSSINYLRQRNEDLEN